MGFPTPWSHIIPSGQAGGKTISIQVEVVDAPLDYNLLLGRNWFYAMNVVASIVFRTVQFPHLNRIVTIDQLDFYMPDITTSMDNNIPMLGQSPPPYQSIGVGMLKDSSLMGFFPSTPLSMDTATVHMIASFDIEPQGTNVVESARSYV